MISGTTAFASPRALSSVTIRDQRASRVGDILTVVVTINDQAQLANETKRSRANSDSENLTNLFGFESHLHNWFPKAINPGSVVDVGGPMWNLEVRKKANATAKAPRVAVAGPLISSVSREKLDLGDPPIVKIDTPDQAREFVRKLADQKPDLVKIWYIVDKDHPVDAFRPIVRAGVAKRPSRCRTLQADLRRHL